MFCNLFICMLCTKFCIFVFFLISDEPEIDVEAEKVHSGLGKEAHLTCIVHGEPRPTVRYILNTLGTTVIIHDTVLWNTEKSAKNTNMVFEKGGKICTHTFST